MSDKEIEEHRPFWPFFKQWSSIAEHIKSSNQSKDVKEQVENVEKDLKNLEKQLSSVSKWGKCSKALFQGLDKVANEIFQHLPNTTPSNSEVIRDKIDEIARKIRDINQALPYLLFFNLWSSKAKTITESSNQFVEAKEQIVKVNDDLKELDESLSSVSKWGEGSKKLFQELNESADEIFKRPQNADNHKWIDKIDEIAGNIRDIKMQRLHFLNFFNLWSSEAEAITESNKQSEDIKEKVEKVQKVKNDMRELDKSLNLVNQWDVVSVIQFQSLHKKSKEFFENFSSKESHQDKLIDEIGRKLREIRKQARPFLELLPKRLNSDETDETIPPTRWNRLESDEETLDDVWSTYHELDPKLKPCFLSLSVFPENSIIRKRSLIYLWIGEGFVEGEEVEEIGEGYFKKLCESGLIEPIYREQSRSPHSCKLHPSIRWMAITIAKETMFFDFNSDGQPCSGPSGCPRRACVSETDKRRAEDVDLKLQDSDSSYSNLLTLFNIDVHFLKCLEEDFKMHKNMTTLQLGRWNNLQLPKYHIEVMNTFLNHLGHLKKLRYLGLQGVSRITELPDSIKHLNEMRVLDLRACHNLEKLPSGITSLEKLTHLDVSECYLLEYMPEGMGSLRNLQFLNGFVVSSLRKQKVCKLNELTKLEKLRKLSISLGVQEEEGVMNADRQSQLEALQHIEGLHTLTITWGLSSSDEKSKDVEKTNKASMSKKLTRRPSTLSKVTTFTLRRRPSTLSKPTSSKILLKLPPILEKLDLRCFPEEDAPELIWGKVEPCLKKLYFRGGNLRSLNGIHEGDQVSQVETVRLRFLKNLKITKHELETTFPKLEYVEFHKCQEIIKTSFLSDKAGDGDKQDEANTSKGAATSGSSVVYRIITHDGTDASNEDKVN